MSKDDTTTPETGPESSMDDISKIKSTADDIASRAKQVTEEAADATRGAAESLTSGARSLADDARETAEDAAESVGQAVDRVGTALREVADDLRDGSLQERTFGQLAQSLADVSDAVREKDLGALSRDVSDFARRNPLLFFGSAALLGFAAARMMSKDRKDT